MGPFSPVTSTSLVCPLFVCLLPRLFLFCFSSRGAQPGAGASRGAGLPAFPEHRPSLPRLGPPGPLPPPHTTWGDKTHSPAGTARQDLLAKAQAPCGGWHAFPLPTPLAGHNRPPGQSMSPPASNSSRPSSGCQRRRLRHRAQRLRSRSGWIGTRASGEGPDSASAQPVQLPAPHHPSFTVTPPTHACSQLPGSAPSAINPPPSARGRGQGTGISWGQALRPPLASRPQLSTWPHPQTVSGGC